MKRLLKYLSEYKKESILGPFFKLCEAVIELFVPLVVADVIDIGIAQADNGYIISRTLILLLIAAVGLLISVTAQYFSAKAAVGFTANVRKAFFDHVESLSCSQLDTLGTSTLIARGTTDMDQIQNGLNIALRLLLRSPFVVIGAMVMAFTVDTRSGAIFAATIPILAVIIFSIMLGTVPLYNKVRSKLDEILRKTKENLEGARVIRAFTLEEKEIDDFKDKNHSLAKLQEFAGKISALLNPATYVIINAAIIILLYTGALKVDAGELTQGNVVALYNYMSQILAELIKFASLVIQVSKAGACANRIADILDIVPDENNGTQSSFSDEETAVEFENVSMKYKGSGENAIENISFTLKKGESLGIIGGTGSGKSTIVSLIPAFYPAQDGQIKIFGRSIDEYSTEFLRNTVGIVEQKTTLFSGSIRENLKWGNPDAGDEELTAALTMAQGSDIVASRPDGLSFELEQNGRNLSGGQRQRLSIARTLVKKPAILILDDSSSALDLATDKRLRHAIGELDDTALIVVSQRTSSVMNLDKILVLEDGKTAGYGTHDELMVSCDVYREIYESQYGTEVSNA